MSDKHHKHDRDEHDHKHDRDEHDDKHDRDEHDDKHDRDEHDDKHDRDEHDDKHDRDEDDDKHDRDEDDDEHDRDEDDEHDHGEDEELGCGDDDVINTDSGAAIVADNALIDAGGTTVPTNVDAGASAIPGVSGGNTLTGTGATDLINLGAIDAGAAQLSSQTSTLITNGVGFDATAITSSVAVDTAAPALTGGVVADAGADLQLFNVDLMNSTDFIL